jgi:hypothetical protein
MFILFAAVSSRRAHHRRVKNVLQTGIKAPETIEARVVATEKLPPLTPGNLGFTTCPTAVRLLNMSKDSHTIRLSLAVAGRQLPPVIAVKVDRAGTVALGDIDSTSRVVVDTAANRLLLDLTVNPNLKLRCMYDFSVDL